MENWYALSSVFMEPLAAKQNIPKGIACSEKGTSNGLDACQPVTTHAVLGCAPMKDGLPLCVTPPYFPQDAISTTTAQPEIIVVPLLQVNTDREQEGSSSTPPPPLVPLGQGATFPETIPTGSPLTFPTLDDFIPPHLQRGPHHHHLPSSPGILPPVCPKLPSFSPPPPLVPPVPEALHRVLEPEITGVLSRTVSLSSTLLTAFLNLFPD